MQGKTGRTEMNSPETHRLALLGGDPTVRTPLPTWPVLSDDEVAALGEHLRRARTDSTYLTSIFGSGPVVEFERAVADYFGAPYAVSTNSGWAALHTALVAVGVRPGDEVIVPAYTWPQSVSCVLQQGAIPVFADIDPETYTLTAETAEKCLSPATKAIVVVHLYGQPADMTRMMAFAEAHGLAVIEDCAQATGAMHRDRHVGTIGTVGCFSIGSGKQIVGGEGGFLLTSSEEVRHRAIAMSQHPQRHRVDLPGGYAAPDGFLPTYRMHPVAASICAAQLPKLRRWNDERIVNLRALSLALEGCPGIRPAAESTFGRHVYHLYCPTFVPEELPGLSRDRYVEALIAEGAPVRIGYVRTPLHLRKEMRERKYLAPGFPWNLGSRDVHYAAGDCPVTEDRCARTDISVFLGANAIGDQSALVGEIAAAFWKVARHHRELLEPAHSQR
ncbi:aminotransferase class I/II-fold pyridoxal phosphate-dependent enzyme [Nonomuraea phyllanthi]|uniref:Aminotransferase class I/II-fold pyridoxal phosphate-dependent enzyme n=2 Tax=Nonomuraea phyllanthi TaxID=2219224 RepID=A0A5C4UTJ8_9ACTN|nr:aminotransferase class I/II-fold pyridoxal phosphate-dependent enzyme [Nonomuraea phyllanthi]